MYVKIIKCSHNKYWYYNYVGNIYPVVEGNNLNYYLIEGTEKEILKSDCEIIDFGDDKISEEFARTLLKTSQTHPHNIEVYISEWKEKGYIKRNRIDEIKEEIDKQIDCYNNKLNENTWYNNLFKLQKELIELLEKK